MPKAAGIVTKAVVGALALVFARRYGMGRRRSRMGLSDHAQARAAGQRHPQADAGQREEIHRRADQRRLRAAGLVSRRASADAADRGARCEAGGAGLRALPSADRRRPSRIVQHRRPAGQLFHPADGRVQEWRPQGRPRHRDGRDRAGDLGRRREGCRRILCVAQARRLDQGGRGRDRAEKLCRPGSDAVCHHRRGSRHRADRQPHYRGAAGRGARARPRPAFGLHRLRAGRQHREGRSAGEDRRRQDHALRHVSRPQSQGPGHGLAVDRRAGRRPISCASCTT